MTHPPPSKNLWALTFKRLSQGDLPFPTYVSFGKGLGSRSQRSDFHLHPATDGHVTMDKPLFLYIIRSLASGCQLSCRLESPRKLFVSYPLLPEANPGDLDASGGGQDPATSTFYELSISFSRTVRLSSGGPPSGRWVRGWGRWGRGKSLRAPGALSLLWPCWVGCQPWIQETHVESRLEPREKHRTARVEVIKEMSLYKASEQSPFRPPEQQRGPHRISDDVATANTTFCSQSVLSPMIGLSTKAQDLSPDKSGAGSALETPC